ncbi:hypothetical protein BT69DRAFT_1356468 [Atractiella rhizophila]|nr:hypothetical protein BT69DRAFT_1356468 [Atractiella rhizophila]
MSLYELVTHSTFPDYALKLKQPKLCDTSVKQYSGYFDVGVKHHLFFWYFESRSDPVNDPLVLWLNGGPGCSSFTGLLTELGPCNIQEGGNGTDYNEWGWNEHANLIFLDQPVNVGYSWTEGELVYDSNEAGKDFYAFLQLFYSRFSQLQKNNFVIAGESNLAPANAAQTTAPFSSIQPTINPSAIPQSQYGDMVNGGFAPQLQQNGHQVVGGEAFGEGNDSNPFFNFNSWNMAATNGTGHAVYPGVEVEHNQHFHLGPNAEGPNGAVLPGTAGYSQRGNVAFAPETQANANADVVNGVLNAWTQPLAAPFDQSLKLTKVALPAVPTTNPLQSLLESIVPPFDATSFYSGSILDRDVETVSKVNFENLGGLNFGLGNGTRSTLGADTAPSALFDRSVTSRVESLSIDDLDELWRALEKVTEDSTNEQNGQGGVAIAGQEAQSWDLSFLTEPTSFIQASAEGGPSNAPLSSSPSSSGFKSHGLTDGVLNWEKLAIDALASSPSANRIEGQVAGASAAVDGFGSWKDDFRADVNGTDGRGNGDPGSRNQPAIISGGEQTYERETDGSHGGAIASNDEWNICDFLDDSSATKSDFNFF